MYRENITTDPVQKRHPVEKSSGSSLSGTHHAFDITPSETSFKISPKFFMEMLLLAEALAFILTALCLKLSYVDLYLDDPKTWLPYVGASLVLGIFFVMTAHFFKLSDTHYLLSRKIPVQKIVLSLSSSFLILLSIFFLLKTSENYSRGWIIMVFFAGLAVISVGHWIAPVLGKFLRSRNLLVRRVAIYGAGDLGVEFQKYIHEQNQFIQITGIYDDSAQNCNKEVLTVRGGLNDLVDAGQQGAFDQIIIALPESDNELLNMVISELAVLPVDVLVRPEISKAPCKIYDIERFHDLNLLLVQRTPLNEYERMAKRSMDLVLAGLGTLFLLPFLPIIAIAIKRDSAGPVFFIQKRHGFNHKEINVLKFRTMSVTETEAKDGEPLAQAEKNDPRVTRVGAFLRRTSLDELPQLANVLLGDMSLVGPRPHAISHNHYYGELVEKYANRHCMKPGITGLAQINGFRGNTENVQMMQQRINFDLEYIEKWSLNGDAEIIFKTVIMMAMGDLSEKWTQKSDLDDKKKPLAS